MFARGRVISAFCTSVQNIALTKRLESNRFFKKGLSLVGHNDDAMSCQISLFLLIVVAANRENIDGMVIVSIDQAIFL